MAWFVYICQHRRFVGPHGTNGQTRIQKLCSKCSEEFENTPNSLAYLMDDKPGTPDHEQGMRLLRGRGGIGRRKGLKIPRE